LAASRDFMERALSQDPGKPQRTNDGGPRLRTAERHAEGRNAPIRPGTARARAIRIFRTPTPDFCAVPAKAGRGGETIHRGRAQFRCIKLRRWRGSMPGFACGGTGDVVDAERYSFQPGVDDPPEFCPRPMLQLGNIAFRSGGCRAGARCRAAVSGGECADAGSALAGGSRGTQAGRCDRGGGLMRGAYRLNFPIRSRRKMMRSGVRSMTDAGTSVGPRLRAERERRGFELAKGRR